MKPLGLALLENGRMLSVRTPTPVEDAVWDAVEAALDAGLTVEAFRRLAREAWSQQLRDRQRADERAWDR